MTIQNEVPVPASQEGADLATRDDPRYPVPDPGHEEHLPRLTDVDEKAADRATRQVATFFGLVPVLAVGFVVVYFAVPSDVYVDFGFLNANAKNLLLGHRHGATSNPEDVAWVTNELDKVVDESQLTRRKVIGRSLLGALAALGLPLIVSFADLGPWPTRAVRKATIESTIWAEGIRLVNDVTYLPIKPEDIEIGQLVNGQPENIKDLHGVEHQQAKAKASIIVVRMDPNTIKIPESRRDWHVNGILCYSKICTHVGCPISLWEQQTHHLLCPCHQSTFDLGDSGLVVFGPAARALPQLPITIDDEGFLVARRGFDVPTGPSYFERDSRRDFKESDN
jgi:ubiquinol-cytochrome c reductase iron-sulfur subunit